jgi:hypothetical protein
MTPRCSAALRFFYRFAGHGTVPYGDHRGEGGLGSNGKDGMIAAAMQVAAHATTGDPSIYQAARDYLSMSTLKSYPAMAVGHADNGRGDGMWRGTAASYLRNEKPDDYRAMMDRITWWYDLSRFHHGGIGIATVPGHNDPGSGAGNALTYTAHLKNLRIHGAPKSKYAVDVKLPDHLWGRPADRKFLSIEHHPKFAEFGPEMPPYRIQNMLGNAYNNADTSDVPRKVLLQNLYHHRYMFRAQSAKALVKAGDLKTIEQLLTDDDPRLRRTALDGINDWRYWFAMGKGPIKPEQFTPGMIDAITAMLTDPDEALYVIEGALFAMHNMPAEVIQKHLDRIMPWTTHEEWWLRQGAFMALHGLSKDEAKYLKVLPTIMQMVVDEYHTQPRGGMHWQLKRTLKQAGADSEIGQIILTGMVTAASESEIKPGLRQREGAWNVLNSIRIALENEPNTAGDLAARLGRRLGNLDTGSLIEILDAGGSGHNGFYPMLAKLKGEAKQKLTDTLYNTYLPVMIQRLKQEPGTNLSLIDTVLKLKQLKQDVDGWEVIGKTAPAEREWRYVSLDPATEAEQKHPRERKRFRDITLPAKYDGWFKPGFDAGGWKTGKAPIGIGEYKKGNTHFPAQSAWGDGEFLLARTTFEVDTLDYDIYRLRVMSNQGYHVYLNGKKIHTYIWWKDDPRYWKLEMSADEGKLLKKGTNTLAVYTNVEFPSVMKPHRWKQEKLGQIDAYIEGLRKSDLY